MAVRLDKILQDLSNADPQIQTFALMSITRLSPQLVEEPAEIVKIQERIAHLVRSPNADVVFLARKAANHIQGQFASMLARGAIAAAPGLALAPAAHPPPMAGAAAGAGATASPVKGPPQTASATPGIAAQVHPAQAAAATTGATPASRTDPVPAVPAQILAPGAPRAVPGPDAAPSQPRLDVRTATHEQLVVELGRTRDPVVLASLASALVARGDVTDLPLVEPLLTHADERVRANSVEVFGAHGDVGSVPLLLPLLKDKGNRVVGNACVALARYERPEVPMCLERMMASGLISMRETAVWVLSVVKKPWALSMLVRAVGDPYEGVRMRVVKALAQHPTRESVEALKRALQDMDINICEAAAESLRAIKAVLTAQRDAARAGPVAPAQATPTASTGVPATPPRTAPPVEPSDAADPHPQGVAPGPGSLGAIYRELGAAVYELCKANALTHDILDGIFYEILRYQDFLRAYMVKKGQPGGDETAQQAAIDKLELKITQAFVTLGKQAAQLAEGKLIMFPEKQKPMLFGMLDRIRRAKRSGAPAV